MGGGVASGSIRVALKTALPGYRSGRCRRRPPSRRHAAPSAPKSQYCLSRTKLCTAKTDLNSAQRVTGRVFAEDNFHLEHLSVRVATQRHALEGAKRLRDAGNRVELARDDDGVVEVESVHVVEDGDQRLIAEDLTTALQTVDE